MEDKCYALVKSGKYKQAIRCYDRALKLDPNNPVGWDSKGYALIQIGKYKEAIRCYDRALKIDASDAEGWYNKGQALVELGKHKEAIRCYDRALKIEPKHTSAWNSKGNCLYKLLNYNQAIQCYDKTLGIDPDNLIGWNNKGISLGVLNKYEYALQCYDRVLKIDPTNAAGWCNKALALVKLGKYEDAILCYDKALKIDRSNPEALKGKAKAQDELQNLTKEEIKGFVFPYNLFVGYKFTYSTLQSALRYFGGNTSFELENGEKPGQYVSLRKNFRFSKTEEAYHHLSVYLTYLHEQLHLRHLSGSPMGVLIYMLSGRQYTGIHQALKKWGKRISGNKYCLPRIPILLNHKKDPEINTIKDLRSVYGLYISLFLGKPKISYSNLINHILPSLLIEVEDICKRVLGKKESFPEIGTMSTGKELLSLFTVLTGEDVIEGLCRCNEFLMAVQLGTPIEFIDRLIGIKMHGKYARTLGLFRDTFGIDIPPSWIIVATLSDWALQAPVFPFLLKGRSKVALEELLPAWRFFLLSSRFQEGEFSMDDVVNHGREVAETIFSSLGWENPWEISERIRSANLPRPTSSITRHYVENMQLSAVIREKNPSILSMPNMADETHKLQAVYNLFKDGMKAGGSGKFLEDREAWSIPAVLLSDVVIDSLLFSENLSKPMWIARHLAVFFATYYPASGHGISAESLLKTELYQLLGKKPAIQLLNPMKTNGQIKDLS